MKAWRGVRTSSRKSASLRRGFFLACDCCHASPTGGTFRTERTESHFSSSRSPFRTGKSSALLMAVISACSEASVSTAFTINGLAIERLPLRGVISASISRQHAQSHLSHGSACHRLHASTAHPAVRKGSAVATLRRVQHSALMRTSLRCRAAERGPAGANAQAAATTASIRT